jgi:hypothetical protein
MARGLQSDLSTSAGQTPGRLHEQGFNVLELLFGYLAHDDPPEGRTPTYPNTNGAIVS